MRFLVGLWIGVAPAICCAAAVPVPARVAATAVRPTAESASRLVRSIVVLLSPGRAPRQRSRARSPAVERAVQLAIHGQIRRVVRILRRERLVDLDAEPGPLARM